MEQRGTRGSITWQSQHIVFFDMQKYHVRGVYYHWLYFVYFFSLHFQFFFYEKCEIRSEIFYSWINNAMLL